MEVKKKMPIAGTGRKDEEAYLQETLQVIRNNIETYENEMARMQEEIDEMLDHYHDNDVEIYTALSNTVTMRDNMKHVFEKNQKAVKKPYFGRIVFYDVGMNKEESLYIGRGGIAQDTTHQMVIDWRAPVANAYYENGLGKCSYSSPEGKELPIDLKLKRTYEIEDGELLEYFDTEVVANDDLLTKYLAKNKQAVLGEIIATIQKEQNEIIRKSPYHNMIVQGVAGSGKTTVAMHRISFILYNYQDRFKPDDFYIVGSNRILLEYITGVLPDLDVYGIRQMTMEQLFVRLLYEDWDEKKYRIVENVSSDQKGWERGTLKWFCDLQEYCRKIEREAISTETIYLNPKQFVEGIKNGEAGVFDETVGQKINPRDMIEIMSGESIQDYVQQTAGLSVQAKINMLNERLIIRIKDEFLKNGIRYSEKERKAILKAYRGRFGKRIWTTSIYAMYQDFLMVQRQKGYEVEIPDGAFDVYDLAALAYLYKRIKETEVISEAHHVVIDEAQDYGMMAYAVLKFCIKDCTYTVMGDVSQNIHFGYGLNDWEELRKLILSGERDQFGVLKKSYRNTVEISEFAMQILRHGSFAAYPAEPIIRHGRQVMLKQASSYKELIRNTADICKEWQDKGLGTIAIICRDEESAGRVALELGKLIPVAESSLEKAVFSDGVMVLPVAYTKGLEFDAVLILDPDRVDYPVDDGHAKLLYVAATRALHELCILHTGNLTGLIADPVPKKNENLQTGMTLEVVEEPKTVSIQKLISKPLQECDKASLGQSRMSEGALKVDNLQMSPTGRKKVAAVVRPAKPVIEPPKTILLTGVKPIVPGRARRERMEGLPQEKEHTEERKAEKRRERHQGGIKFGDMPINEKLRPAGHSKIDLAVKWVYRQEDGLYLQSRYGILRLSPVKSDVIRVTFAREGEPKQTVHSKIALQKVEEFWMYKETGNMIELLTDDLCLQVDNQTGAIRYMSRSKKLLLEEKNKECRQIESTGEGRSWIFFDWKKEEKLYTPGVSGEEGLKLKGSARYIQPDTSEKGLPTVISDKGYCLIVATDHPVICCDIPAYGSYLSTEGDKQIDYYFSLMRSSNSILVS